MSSPTYTVFYAWKLYDEYFGNLPTMDLPDGAYVRTKEAHWYVKHWYVKQFSTLTPLNHSDIPKNLLALCLILGLT